MKAFIISLSMTVVLTTIVIANAVYISDTTERMKSLVEQISRDGADYKAFEELEGVWTTHRRFFAISVGFEEIDRVTEYITRLGCAVECQDLTDVRRSCALLQIFFDDVTRHEKISLLNIL